MAFDPGTVEDPWSWTRPWKDLWNRIASHGEGCTGHDSRRLRVQSFVTIVEMFRIQTGRYPTQDEGLQVLAKDSIDEKGRRIHRLINEMPRDHSGRLYQYRIPATHSGAAFDLFSLGPDGILSPDDIGNWVPPSD